MEFSRTILGPVVTEKAERLKTKRTYVMHVAQGATKVDIKAALRHFYDVEVEDVRVFNVRPKERPVGQGRTMQKRAPARKALVTLTSKSKPLDLAVFKHR
ncbi:MAG: 50S ribosomal protein L23 [Candidatus Peribacteraceae bacterium]|nr:50S ribosomal protein L23 [Candidatus Peribacteraceae bacterium]